MLQRYKSDTATGRVAPVPTSAPPPGTQVSAPAVVPPPSVDPLAGDPARTAVSIRLEKRSVRDPRGEHWQIDLREPTLGDWFECGGDMHQTIVIDPAAMAAGREGAAKIEPRPDVIAKWFSRLSGLPYSVITQMHLDDARRVFRELTHLVGSIDAGNSQTPPSSSG